MTTITIRRMILFLMISVLDTELFGLKVLAKSK